MARLRRGRAYRHLERPYTRFSKYKKDSFIRAKPNVKVVRFDMGNLRKSFTHKIELISKQGLQIRQESIESARQTCNRHLERKIGKQNYNLKIKIYPFHVLRENPLAKGAGADRFSTGMAHAFGKPIGLAARVRKGQVLFSVSTNKDNLKQAKEALRKANSKMAARCTIQVPASS